MTFRPNSSDVKICNQALSRLGQAPITSISPPTPLGTASRECARWYSQTVGRLLELHHWGLARKRVPLTETTNTRPAEWVFAYELPADCAFPVTLSAISSTGSLTYYQGLAGLLGVLNGRPAFLRVGNILYSRYSGDLDYVSYDITESDFNATFTNIVELTLAAAMCFAINKNQKREDTLRQQATTAINIAIAQNLGAGQPRYGDTPSDRDIARGAAFDQPYGYGWNWDWTPGNG